MAGLEGEVLGTIIPDTTVHIINTRVKPVWLFCLGRNPIHGFKMFYLFLQPSSRDEMTLKMHFLVFQGFLILYELNFCVLEGC